jgi:S1-C subfamily serine protease
MSNAVAALSQSLAGIVETTGRSVVRVEGHQRRPASGIVWDKNRVVTALHVVEGSDALVVVHEGKELKAKVKGKDATRDLALLEVDGALPVAAFDDGEKLRVGNFVLHLARPGETVRATFGIVSGQGTKPWRTPRGGEVDRFLESDAPHQPGFSGGPAVGLDGRVLGLSTSGLVRGQSVIIPTPTLRKVLPQLEAHGTPRQSWLGVQMQPARVPDEVKAATGDEIGLVVLSVSKGGPADKAGIQYGDTLLHLGDDSVKTLDDLYGYLRADHVGQTVPAKVWRAGKVETLTITLEARP